MALEHPEKFVLKPQREGGGNNYYGEEMVKVLKKMKENEWAAFILMELIISKPFDSTIVRNNELFSGQCISELGIYSGFIANQKKEIVLNSSLGYLLRSKFSHINETGVSAGFGALDSVHLTK